MAIIICKLVACGGGGGSSNDDDDNVNDPPPPTSTGPLISELNFDDAELQQCVSDVAAELGFTYQNQVTILICRDYGISELNGVDRFVSLRRADFTLNPLNEASVSYVDTASIDITRSKLVSELEFSDGFHDCVAAQSQLSQWTYAYQFTELDCSNQDLDNLDFDTLGDFSGLKFLDVSDNDITVISGTPLRENSGIRLDTLDISRNPLYDTGWLEDREDFTLIRSTLVREITFTDDNFRRCVAEVIVDTGLADSFAEAGNVYAYLLTTFNCEGMAITSTEGLEYFTDLTQINFHRNEISEISLESHPNLNTVTLTENPITEASRDYLSELETNVQLSPLVANLEASDAALLACITNTAEAASSEYLYQVEQLDCSSRDIVEVDAIYALNNLRELDLSRNQITVFDPSLTPSLTSLAIQENPIAEPWRDAISETFGGVSARVDELAIEDNGLSQCIEEFAAEEGFEFAYQFEDLACVDRDIETLDFNALSDFTRLKNLDVSNNNISTLVGTPLEESNGIRLDELNITRNPLYDTEWLEGLDDFTLIRSQLAREISFTDDNFRRCIAEAIVDQGLAESFAVAGNVYAYLLTTLNCEDGDIASVDSIEYFTDLTHINFHQNEISEIFLGNHPNLMSVTLTENPVVETSRIHLAELTADVRLSPLVVDLEASDAALLTCIADTAEIAGREYLYQIDALDCSDRGIGEVDAIYALTNLSELDLSRNQVAVFDPSLAPTLTTLAIRENPIDEPWRNDLREAFGDNILSPTIDELSIDNTVFYDCLGDSAPEEGFEFAYQFSEINCSNSELNSVPDLIEFTNLTNLDISSTLVRRMNINRAPSLNYINIINTPISLEGFEALIATEGLQVDHSPLIEDLVFADEQLKDCVSESLTDTAIFEFSVLTVRCSNLASLAGIDQLTNIRLLDVDTVEFASLDLSQNGTLEYVAVNNGSLEDVTFADDNSLLHLDLSGNQLHAIDLSQLNALTYLYLTQNHIQDVDIRNNPRLEELYLSENQISTFEVLENPSLKILSITQNQLSSLDLSGAIALEELYAGVPVSEAEETNMLQSVDLSVNGQLKIVSIPQNQISAIDLPASNGIDSLILSFNQLERIDLSQQANLSHLIIDNNQITSIDISSITALQELDVSGNMIEQIDLFSSTALESLDVSKNELTTLGEFSPSGLRSLNISDNAFASFDTSVFSTLNSLDVSGNDLTELDVSLLDELKLLNIADNALTDLDVLPLFALEFLDISGNDFTSLDVSPLRELKFLNISDNAFTELDVTLLVNLVFLGIDNTEIEDVDLSQNLNLNSLSAAHSALEALDLSANHALSELDLDGAQLNDIDVSALSLLQSLNVAGLQLSELEVGQNLSLIDLNADDNDLIAVDVSRNEQLEVLSLASNNIEDIDLSHNLVLTSINLSANPLETVQLVDDNILTELNLADTTFASSFDLTSVPNLTVLDFSGANLTDINLNAIPNLEDLNLSTNELTDIDLSNLVQLKSLTLDNNQLTNFVLDQAPLLEKLSLNDNGLTELDLSGVDSLEVLFVEDNHIENINLEHLVELTRAHLSNNMLASIELPSGDALNRLILRNNQLASVDITAVEGLSILDLGQNQLGSLDLSQNTQLAILNIDNNALSTLDLQNNPDLILLNIRNNDITRLNLDDNTLLRSVDIRSTPIVYDDVIAIEDLNITTFLRSDFVLDSDYEDVNFQACVHDQSEVLGVAFTFAFTTLSCSGYGIETLSLSDFIRLESLDLSNNNISSFAPALLSPVLDSLTELTLSGNPIPDDQLDELRDIEGITVIFE